MNPRIPQTADGFAVKVRHMSVELQQQIDALKAQFESKLNELQRSIAKNLTSRRGAEGARGEKGDPGVSNVPGPKGDQGERGKQGDQGPQGDRGVSNTPGPQGSTGPQGSVGLQGERGLVGPQGQPGPKGETGQTGQNGHDGESITGPAGRDAQVAIGTVSTGDQASASIRVENGVSHIDFVLPASTVAGPAGADGAGVSENDVSYMGSKFRNQWKNDIQAALRAHFSESHADTK